MPSQLIGRDTANQHFLPRTRLTLHDLDLCPGDAQRIREQFHDGAIRRAAFGRLGNRHFQGVAQQTDDPIARSARDDLDLQDDARCARGEMDGQGCAYATNRFTMIVSFCPPKPKLLLRATSTFAGRALFGT